MKQSTKDYFESHRQYYDMMLSQDYIPRAGWGMPSEIYDLIRSEFDAGYENDTQCPPCAFSIIKYGYYKYEEALKQELIKVAASFPKHDQPLNIPIIETVDTFGTISEDGKGMNLMPFQPEIKISSRDETPEERKARLADPNRIIKPRKKRK